MTAAGEPLRVTQPEGRAARKERNQVVGKRLDQQVELARERVAQRPSARRQSAVSLRELESGKQSNRANAGPSRRRFRCLLRPFLENVRRVRGSRIRTRSVPPNRHAILPLRAHARRHDGHAAHAPSATSARTLTAHTNRVICSNE